MATVRMSDAVDVITAHILRLLPYRVSDEVRLICRERGRDIIEEIHLRRGSRASVICNGENITIDYVAEGDELDELLSRLCGGSLYAYRDSINEGYVTVEGGVRVGVCGLAAVENGRLVGVSRVTSLVLRIPHRTPSGVGGEIRRLLESDGMTRGVLIYSPPGVGKTTVLRGAISCLACGESRRRVAVVDTRGELGACLDAKDVLVDILSGYPRRRGIEIAARTLNAQVIVCDEIGDADEASAIEAAHNCGIPLVASAHSASLGELLRKPGILRLHRSRCFGKYVRISRRGRFSFNYDTVDWDHADGIL